MLCRVALGTQRVVLDLPSLCRLSYKVAQRKSVRPCSSIGRVTVEGGRGFDSHRGQKIFSLPRVVPCFPLLCDLVPVNRSAIFKSFLYINIVGRCAAC